MPKARESCGLAGVYGPEDAAYRVYLALYSLQHRGQEGAGIVSSDGVRLHGHRHLGLVGEVFGGYDFSALPGRQALGHVRYSTTGSTSNVNTQPLLMEYRNGEIAVAHNGNIVNARALREEYESYGSIFQTTSDSEIIVHLIARPAHAYRRDALAHCLRHLQGAFSLIIMTSEALMGARDPWGFRPLALGKVSEGYVLASETCAFDQLQAEFIREVEPGELVTIDDKGIRSEIYMSPAEVGGTAHCVFEHIYFARPDSVVFGENVHTVRKRLGRKLAEAHPVDGDTVVSVPEGGTSAAIGYSEASGLPYDRGFVANLYVGRTFIRPAQRDRENSADIKINVVKDVVDGKRVVVVDDSIVRGTTLRNRLARLRRCGAREIHLRITCPPHRHPCYYGIDFPTSDELIAHGREEEEIGRMLGVDSIAYLSVEEMLEVMSKDRDGYCTACFSGEYPVIPEGRMDKFVFEQPRYGKTGGNEDA
ncbi:MAG: amidophosphoribosyltransferase [Planctomycetes bacterium]|nr:amidophosphoribosyltransferase [Planctomycetota bacterium]